MSFHLLLSSLDGHLHGVRPGMDLVLLDLLFHPDPLSLPYDVV
jgi:hypothetical protein